MTSTPEPGPLPDQAREKVDEEDHDLLTFGEVHERLRLEISSLTTLIDTLTASGSTADLQAARTRLDALQAAARRNTADPINDANFENFFGYPGKAKRNLPGPASEG